MPLLALPVIWSWISSGWVAFILPLLKVIPWQVWAILGLIVAFLYYGHIRENRGYDKCHVEVVNTTRMEDARRLEAANATLLEAQSRAQESARRASSLEGELSDTQKQVQELKTAKTVCLPKSVTDRYGSGRVRGSK